MPSAISEEIRRRVIKQWLSGDTRAKIASDSNIGQGSVTNIVSDFNRGMADPELGSIREFAVESQKTRPYTRRSWSSSEIYQSF